MRFVVPMMLLSGCVIRVECERHTDCGSAEMCWDNRCEATTDRFWLVEMVAADVGYAHPDSYAWDEDYSPPDLFAEFGLPDDRCITTIRDNAYTPEWAEVCDFYVPPNPDFVVNLWDADGVYDELATSYEWLGVGEFTALAREAGGVVGFEDDSGTIVTWMMLTPE